jgi:uncharacterized protein YecE (DUF72 family)
MVEHADSESLFDDDPLPARAAGATNVLPAAIDEALARLARRLPTSVHLGTSSWSFPGWNGIVYGGEYSEAQLARHGLAVYARHPLLRTVSLDRGYYQPLTDDDYVRYARDVPEQFRFVVKAPALVTDTALRRERGAAAEPNPSFLDVAAARDAFVLPALAGLGRHTGPLLFQLPPLPAELTRGDAAHGVIDRIGAMLAALPRELDGIVPLYAVELRSPELLTPRLVRTLRESGARLCVGLHARMPPAGRQSAALRAMDALEEEGDDWKMKGPLVVRWNLAAGFRYEDARQRYAPFDRIIDPDITTRGALAHLVHVAMRSQQPSYVVANNKAEGSAPLSVIELAKAIVHRPLADR